MGFGSFIRAGRAASGRTLVEVAEEVGISVPYLSRIERDCEAPPAEVVIRQIASAIGISAKEALAAAEADNFAPQHRPSAFAVYRRLGR